MLDFEILTSPSSPSHSALIILTEPVEIPLIFLLYMNLQRKVIFFFFFFFFLACNEPIHYQFFIGWKKNNKKTPSYWQFSLLLVVFTLLFFFFFFFFLPLSFFNFYLCSTLYSDDIRMYSSVRDRLTLVIVNPVGTYLPSSWTSVFVMK